MTQPVIRPRRVTPAAVTMPAPRAWLPDWSTAIRALRGSVGVGLSSLAIMGIGMALWLADVTSLQIADLDDLGIFRAISPSAYVGLTLIVGAYVLTLHKRLTVPTGFRYVQVIVVIVALFAVTPLFEPVLGYRVSYRHAGVVDYITTTSSVDPSIDAYFNWPGFFAFGSFMNEVAGVDNSIEIAHWAPLFYNVLYLAPVVMIMRTATTNERRVWAGVLVFYLGNWVGQDYFSPQATAYLLYLVLLALVLRWLSPRDPVEDETALDEDTYVWPGMRPPPGRSASAATMLVVVIILFAAIVPTHQLTPFAAILCVSALVVTRRCTAVRLPIIMVVLLAAWMTFMASAYLSGNFSSLLSQVGQVGSIFEENVNRRIAGSSDHQSVVSLRLTLSALLVVLAAVGYLRSSRRTVDESMAICCGAPILLLGLQNYGGEVLLRAYLFSLPFAAYFTATVFIAQRPKRSSVKTFLMPLAVVALVAFSTTGFLIARYGNQRIDSFTAAELTAVNELYDVAPPGSLLLAGIEVLPWKHREYDTYKYRSIDDLDGVRSGQVTPFVAAESALRTADDGYFIVSRAQFAYEDAFGSLPDAELVTLEADLLGTGSLELIYENTDARIYRYDDQAGS